MGAGIHMLLQTRFDKRSSWWICLENIDVERNYELFGYLAGVRDATVMPIAEPRGWPKDFNEYEEEQLPSWLGDHTPSWLLASELKTHLPTKFQKDPWYKCVKAYAKRDGWENTRIVFNFDS